MKLRHTLIILFAILLFLSKNLGADADELSVSANAMAVQEASSPENITSEDETPMFHAAVEYHSHGYYIVKGTFTEFLPDTVSVHPMYSLDGENWQLCGQDWNLDLLDNIEDEYALEKLQTQICLYSNEEPLKNYLDGELDSFYLKLHITRENGETYETQPAVIERGVPQTVPEEISLIASFTPAMRVRETKPFNVYGRYQITINADASPEDVSAFLPDTLPVTVGLYQGIDFITEGTINCPITWKPLSFSQLTAGESITIPDAAEEIIIPGDTLLSTPMGIFQLDEPLGLNHDMVTDEIRLVLNVISENEIPTGALAAENNGLELAFQLKPTGAAAIRAYTFSTGDNEWKELPALPLLDAVNAQPSTANSGYTLVMHRDWEPYRSYLSAEASGETPSPFLIGLKIEGGVYDGQQLILPWPTSYDLPLNLPVLGGSGGNEDNAGADNKNDSTEEGQRPELPQQPEEKTEELPTAPAQKPEDNTEDSPSAPAQKSEGNTEDSPSPPAQKPEGSAEDSPSPPAQKSEGNTEDSPSPPAQKPEGSAESQPQNQSQPSENARTAPPLNPPSKPEAQTDTPAGVNTTDTKTNGHWPLLPIAAASVSCIGITAVVHKAVRRSAGTP